MALLLAQEGHFLAAAKPGMGDPDGTRAPELDGTRKYPLCVSTNAGKAGQSGRAVWSRRKARANAVMSCRFVGQKSPALAAWPPGSS